MSREIELKLKIDSDEFILLDKWLKDKASYQHTLTHLEHYLDNPHKTFFFQSTSGYEDSLDYVRVRFTDTGHYLCYKKFYIDDKDGLMKNLFEHDIKVDDGRKALEFMKTLGFVDKIIVNKTRKTYNYDRFEIVLDEVNNLGSFVEIELKEDVENYDEGVEQIKNLLSQIGINKYKQFQRGYASMLLNPDYDFSY